MKELNTCPYCNGTGKIEITSKLSFGVKLLKLREKQGVTQAELGKRIGLARTSINNMEHGRQNVGIETIYKISEALNVKPTYFFK